MTDYTSVKSTAGVRQHVLGHLRTLQDDAFGQRANGKLQTAAVFLREAGKLVEAGRLLKAGFALQALAPWVDDKVWHAAITDALTNIALCYYYETLADVETRVEHVVDEINAKVPVHVTATVH